MGKLSVKFMLRTVVVVVVGISALGWIMTRALESEVRARADQAADDQVEEISIVLHRRSTISVPSPSAPP
jgi:hypothetical protein